MFTNTFEFSAMKSGDQHRLLVTRGNRLGTKEPAEAVLTGTPTQVEDLRRNLKTFASFNRYALLGQWTQTHPSQRCELRRTVGTALAAADPKTCAYELGGVIDAANQVGPAARKAVHQLVLDMLDGSDDIPVRVTAKAWELDDSGTCYANWFLSEHAEDADVVGLAANGDYANGDTVDHDRAVETMRDYLVEEYAWVDEWLEHCSPSFEVNLDDLHTWVAAHRPHLLPQLDELTHVQPPAV